MMIRDQIDLVFITMATIESIRQIVDRICELICKAFGLSKPKVYVHFWSCTPCFEPPNTIHLNPYVSLDIVLHELAHYISFNVNKDRWEYYISNFGHSSTENPEHEYVSYLVESLLRFSRIRNILKHYEKFLQ